MVKANKLSLLPIQMGLFLIIELQLVFGETFTKLNVIGPLYLSDLLLGLLGVYAIFTLAKSRKPISISWPIFIMLGISFVYLVYSFISNIGPVNYIIRHYALFIYIGINYIIFQSFIDESSKKNNLKFFVLIGISALVLQVLWHLYRFITVPDYYLLFFDDFNYYSELVTPGLFMLEIWALCFLSNKYLKYSIVILILFLSTTLGHSSAFLACFIPAGFYFILNLKFSTAIWAILTAGILMAFYFFLPQFSDGNAQFRLLYWREILKQSILEYYAIFGHGFGGSFITESMNQVFLSEIDSIHFDVNLEEKFLTPMHNSFITIMFHIGILPGLLVFVPLRNAFGWAFNNKIEHGPERKFIFLSFVGFAVWSAFNVILEMPHSSAYFWLVYFTLVYEFRNENEKSFTLLPKQKV